MLPTVSVVLTCGDGSSFAPALRERLERVGGGASEVRWSRVVDTLDGLTDVRLYMCIYIRSPLVPVPRRQPWPLVSLPYVPPPCRAVVSYELRALGLCMLSVVPSHVFVNPVHSLLYASSPWPRVPACVGLSLSLCLSLLSLSALSLCYIHMVSPSHCLTLCRACRVNKSVFLEKKVCRGADVVYLLSALELPDSPDKRRLRDFRAGKRISVLD